MNKVKYYEIGRSDVGRGFLYVLERGVGRKRDVVLYGLF